MNVIEQYQGVRCETAVMGQQRASLTADVTASPASIDHGHGHEIRARPPRSTRGVNSEVEQAAGNSHTRLTSVSPGPDFIFSAKYLGGN